MDQTLIVFASTKKDYEDWVRRYGCYYRNVYLVWANGDLKGYGKDSTFWTTLEFWEDGPEPTTDQVSKYKYVPREKIEDQVDAYLKKHPSRVLTY